MHITKETILKYDKPGPRYTSYPTAPEWSVQTSSIMYEEKLRQFGKNDKTLSLYLHLPFCKSMCTFCACSVIIRKTDAKYADEYLDYLFKEIELIRAKLGKNKAVRQLHWGGGTPNFLNEDQMERLFKKINENFQMDKDAELAIEIDPRTITENKIKKLHVLGFNRISMGIQDFEETVQHSINRIQSFEMVRQCNDWCRAVNFKSVNFDLVYGLPRQTLKGFTDTVQKVVALRPDRIALYSFAYVPWLKKHQQKIDAQTLPTNDEKLDIFLQARSQFLKNGYEAIAMDHFALASDELTKAYATGALYRNFMGYTVKPADEYIGLGITAIGFVEKAFIQNHKTLHDYFESLDRGELPIERGKVLNEDDQIRQWVINSLMCQFLVDKQEFRNQFGKEFDVYFAQEQEHIRGCAEEKLLTVAGEHLRVTDLGKIFIRNICMGFDWYLRQTGAHTRFSKTV